MRDRGAGLLQPTVSSSSSSSSSKDYTARPSPDLLLKLRSFGLEDVGSRGTCHFVATPLPTTTRALSGFASDTCQRLTAIPIVAHLVHLAIRACTAASPATFSSFGLETIRLLQAGEWLTALTYALVSNGFGLIAVILGLKIAG